MPTFSSLMSFYWALEQLDECISAKSYPRSLRFMVKLGSICGGTTLKLLAAWKECVLGLTAPSEAFPLGSPLVAHVNLATLR